MDHADQADAARRLGDTAELNEPFSFFTKPLKHRSAVVRLPQNSPWEPSRSICTAALLPLALDCAEYREAERLICQGLAGRPGGGSGNELRDQSEPVNFERHLGVCGVTLARTDIQLVLAGDGVDYGTIQGDFVAAPRKVNGKISLSHCRALNRLTLSRKVHIRGVHCAITLGFIFPFPVPPVFAVTLRLRRHSAEPGGVRYTGAGSNRTVRFVLISS